MKLQVQQKCQDFVPHAPPPLVGFMMMESCSPPVQILKPRKETNELLIMSMMRGTRGWKNKLVKDYCTKYNVQLSSSKTKLMKITPPRAKTKPEYNPININGEPIGFVKEAEHVGVLRSTDGNMPNILQRVTAFKNALGSIVSCGLAHGRTSNPSASFRILACPVLCYQARKLPALTSSSRGNFRALSSCLPIPLPHWSTL